MCVWPTKINVAYDVKQPANCNEIDRYWDCFALKRSVVLSPAIQYENSTVGCAKLT